MKIDFNSGYKSLAKIIFAKEAGASDAQLKANFNSTLEAAGRLNPKAIDIINKTVPLQADVEPQLQPPRSEGLGYMDQAPKLHAPIPSPKELVLETQAPETIVESNTGPVKSPSVVSAKRISVPLDYSDTSPGAKTASFKPMIESLGIKHGVDPALGLAVAQAESSFNPQAVSKDGHYSKGLFQLLDKTGKDMMARLDHKSTYDPYDPKLNSDLGLGYLRYLHDIFSSSTELPNKRVTVPAANSSSLEKLAVAAYNAGEGRVASAQKRASAAGKDPSEYDQIASYLPDITQKYVERVTRFKSQFSTEEIDS